MKINLKHSQTKWVDIDGESSFEIGYPTIEQSEKLKQLAYEIALVDDRLMEVGDEARENILSALPADKKAKMLILNEKLYKMTIKYSVKDWKGVPDSDGKDVDCVIINNELHPELYKGLVKDLDLGDLSHIYACILNEIEVTETDKKKLSSQESSTTKESSQEE